jgi:hypothetical protein
MAITALSSADALVAKQLLRMSVLTCTETVHPSSLAHLSYAAMHTGLTFWGIQSGRCHPRLLLWRACAESVVSDASWSAHVGREAEMSSCPRSLNQKLVLPRYAYFSVPGSLQRYSLRANSTELHVPLPEASAAGEALLAHHLVSSGSTKLHVHEVGTHELRVLLVLRGAGLQQCTRHVAGVHEVCRCIWIW